jgi:TP901 family phage tail tape measure protein
MAARSDLEIRINIDSKDVKGNLGKVQDEFRTASEGIAKSLSGIQAFADLKKQSAETAKAFGEAQKKVKELADAIQTGSGGKDLTREFEQAKKAAAGLKETLSGQQQSLQQMRTAMAAAGGSTKGLAEQQIALRAQLEATKTKYQELAKLSGARDLLGVAPKSEVQAEIAKMKAAYADLARSGKLSMAELAQAKVALGTKIDELKNKTNGWRTALGEVKGGFLEVAASVAPTILAIGQAIAFESAMANVKKVVDATPAAFAVLRGEILAMTRTLPLAAGEVAQIATAAGQLGVATGDISAFTLVTAKMATAFDMSAEAAGDSIGKIKNVYQLGIKEVEGLGDAINQLGNNSASREKDIVEVMLRIGGSAKQFGLAEEQAASLAAAMLSLGKTPETAATAINSLLNRMQTATMQAPPFQKALDTLGISAEDLASSVQEGPQQAITDFLATLAKLDGRQKSEVLTGLFGREFQDDIAVLVGGLKTYEDALKTVADKTSYAGSMNKEFETRSATTANQLKLLKNAVSEAGINLGTTFLPAIRAVIAPVTGLIRLFADMAATFPHLSAGLATFGTGALIFGQVAKLSGIAKLAMIGMAGDSIAAMRSLMVATLGVGTSVKAMGGALAIGKAGMLAFSAAVAANPIGAALTAAILLGAGAWAVFGGSALDASRKHAEAATKIGEARKASELQLEALKKLQKVFQDSKPGSDAYLQAERELARILPGANITLDARGRLMAKVGTDTDTNNRKLREHIALLQSGQGTSFALQLEQQAKAIKLSSQDLETYKQKLKDLYGYDGGEPTWLQGIRKSGHEAMGSYDKIIGKGKEVETELGKQKTEYENLFRAMQGGNVTTAQLAASLDKMNVKAELKQSIIADYQKFTGVIGGVATAAEQAAAKQEAAFRSSAEAIKGQYLELATTAKRLLGEISAKQQSLAAELREMGRGGMSAADAWKDLKKEADEYYAAAESAAQKGDFGESIKLFKEAGDKYKQLNVEVVENGKVVVSAEENKKKSMELVKNAREAEIEVTKKQAGEAEDAAEKLAEQIGAFKDGWTSAFEAFLKDGKASIDSLEKELDALTSKQRTITVNVKKVQAQSSGGIVGYAQGGMIGALRMAGGGAVNAFRNMLSGGYFPGFGGGDRRHVVAEDGEYMLDKYRVQDAGLNTVRAFHAGRYDIVVSELLKRMRGTISRQVGGIIDRIPTLPAIGPQYMAAGGAVQRAGSEMIRHEHILKVGNTSAKVYTDDLNAGRLLAVFERARRMAS